MRNLNIDNDNYDEIRNNCKYNFNESDKVRIGENNLYNNSNFINNNIVDNNDFKLKMNDKVESNNKYRTLEQRVFMLEKEIINQQNRYNNIQFMNRDTNYYPYNTQQNLNIFQNGFLSEKVRPLSVKNSSTNNKQFKINAKIKKKKRKIHMNSNENGPKRDENYENKSKKVVTINKKK